MFVPGKILGILGDKVRSPWDTRVGHNYEANGIAYFTPNVSDKEKKLNNIATWIAKLTHSSLKLNKKEKHMKLLYDDDFRIDYRLIHFQKNII
jgi:hypothetical protein